MLPRRYWFRPYRHTAHSRELIDPDMNDDPEDEEVFRGDFFEDTNTDGWWPPLSGDRDEFGEVTE